MRAGDRGGRGSERGAGLVRQWAWPLTSRGSAAQSVSSRRSVRSCRVFAPEYEKFAKIFDRQYHSPSKVLKLEDDPWGSCAMYSPEKMKSGGGLMAPPGCFPGRYSPTYRGGDPRRCVPNPSVSTEPNLPTILHYHDPHCHQRVLHSFQRTEERTDY
ncbi:hypothetical protein O0L34_g2305 [Tuta absoluta]|nr:hypothetical protein O0L34_g2305 [Tuta absoluta]